jgi:hypothetical protein
MNCNSLLFALLVELQLLLLKAYQKSLVFDVRPEVVGYLIPLLLLYAVC